MRVLDIKKVGGRPEGKEIVALIDRTSSGNYVMPYVVAYGYDSGCDEWEQGYYYEKLENARAEFEKIKEDR